MVKFAVQHGFIAFLLLLQSISSTTGMYSSSTHTDNDFCIYSGIVTPENDVPSTRPAFFTASASNRNRQPILLHYLIRLIGNDWLGADWVYIGLTSYRYPTLDSTGQQVYLTDPVTGKQIPQWNYTRFWIDPGPALLKTGDTLWVWGYLAETHTIYADSIQVNPPSRVAPPDDVSASGRILAISAQTLTIQDAGGINYSISVDSYTTYSFPSNTGLPRPHQGLWLNISWLTGANGLLSPYAGFHGSYRGILRLDFKLP
jgi:hypothetical protein